MMLFKFKTVRMGKNQGDTTKTGYAMAKTLAEAAEWIESEVGTVEEIHIVSTRAFICHLGVLEKNDRPS
jgi:hypothetical protein